MLILSGIIFEKVAIEDNADIQNCFFCNFDNGTIVSTKFFSVFIDSCFFEEDTHWNHGGAFSISNADTISISKVFGKACSTKSTDGERYGQFLFVSNKETTGTCHLIESCISSCAPFIEKDDRRSVIEYFNGILTADNINFSNNMAIMQIFRTSSSKTTTAKRITFYRNTLTKSYVIMHSRGQALFEENQFAMNTMDENDKRIVIVNTACQVTFKTCSFTDVEGCSFSVADQCIINIESCYLESTIKATSAGQVNYIGSPLNSAPQTLVHQLMRDGIRNVLNKGYCTSPKEKTFTAVTMITLLIPSSR